MGQKKTSRLSGKRLKDGKPKKNANLKKKLAKKDY